MKNENYYVVHGWMINRLHLTGNDLLAYAIIYGFTQDGKSLFNGSYKYLSAGLGVSVSTVKRIIKRLCDQELIIKHTEQVKGVQFNSYTAKTLQEIETAEGGGVKMTPPGSKRAGGGVKMTPGGGVKMTHYNNTINKNIDNNSSKEKSIKKKKPLSHFEKDELNKVAPGLADTWFKWLDYKKKEKNFRYKKKETESAALRRAYDNAGQDLEQLADNIDFSIANAYQGIFEDHNRRGRSNRNIPGVPVSKLQQTLDARAQILEELKNQNN